MPNKYYIAPYPIHRWAIYKTGDIRISDVYTLKSQAEADFDLVIKRPTFYMKKDKYRKLCYGILGLKEQAVELGYDFPETAYLQKVLDTRPKALEHIHKQLIEFIEEHKDG